jgi:hypothetical protein
MTLHSIGVAYFDYGWAVMTLITMVASSFTKKAKHPNTWLALCMGIPLVVGGFFFYCKYRL